MKLHHPMSRATREYARAVELDVDGTTIKDRLVMNLLNDAGDLILYDTLHCPRAKQILNRLSLFEDKYPTEVVLFTKKLLHDVMDTRIAGRVEL